MQSRNTLSQLDAFAETPVIQREFTIAEVRRQPTLKAALNLAVSVSGLLDKQISGPLKIQEAQFSRIMDGKNWFPNDEKYLGFLNLTNNDIPTIWAAERRGFDWSTIRPHRSNLEREVERLKGEVAKRDEAIALFVRAGK